MGVGAAVGQPHAVLRQPVGQRRRVGCYLPLGGVERRGVRDLEGHGHRPDLVEVRPALFARKHRPVDPPHQPPPVRQDHRGARSEQRLVRCEGDDVGQTHRRRILAGRHHPRRVRNVGQQVGAHLVGDGAKSFPIRRPRVRGVARHDDARMVASRDLRDLVVIEPAVNVRDAVTGGPEPATGAVDRRAVAQVPAMGQGQPHDRVVGFQQRLVDGVVGGRARERLHVDVQTVRRDARVGIKGRAATLGQRFHQVGVVVAAVVTAVAIAPEPRQLPGRVRQAFRRVAPHRAGGVALSVDAGQGRSQRRAHRGRRQAFRRNQDQLVALAAVFQGNQVRHQGIDIVEVLVEDEIGVGRVRGHGRVCEFNSSSLRPRACVTVDRLADEVSGGPDCYCWTRRPSRSARERACCMVSRTSPPKRSSNQGSPRTWYPARSQKPASSWSMNSRPRTHLALFQK